MATSRPSALFAPGAAISPAEALFPSRDSALPAVDERLVSPETPFEIIDGRVVETMGSHEAHAVASGELVFVLRAALRPAFRCAVDMLTRADRYSDVAPDASVLPQERDAAGGRQLEHLVFEVRDSQPLSDVTRKAELLSARGVRRIFCIEVPHNRVLEWNVDGWNPLDPHSLIEDPVCFASPIATASLLDAVEADNSAARALLAKKNPVLREALSNSHAAGRAEELRQTIVDLCDVLALSLDEEKQRHIAALDLSGLVALRDSIKRTRRWDE